MTESANWPVSPDGRWKWNGAQWVPNDVGYGYSPPVQPGPAGYGTPPQYGYLPVPPATQNDGKAIGSLVASLLGLFCGIGSVVGVVLGHQSRGEAKRQGREPSGLALAGLIIGYCGIALLVVVLIVFALGTWVHGAFEDTSTTFCPGQPSASC